MSRKHPPQPPRQRWLRWLLLALPLLSLPILYAALGSARSPPPRLGGRQQQHPLLPPPRLAYLITGGPGDGPRIRRLLRALYHPWNYYLVGVAGEEDRADLEAFVRGEEAPRRYGNVRVASPGQWAAISRRGPTELAATLHGAALLLKEFQGWSWFINLSASDYPLMPQDEEGEAGAGAVVAALAMIRTQDQLCDRDADPDEIPGLNVAIEESRNVVPTLSFEDASAWSLKEHAKSTGHPYLDLRGDDVDAGPNSAKSENDEDDGAGNGVKAKAGWEDYSPFH